MTFRQLEPSAKAPWTRTTTGLSPVSLVFIVPNTTLSTRLSRILPVICAPSRLLRKAEPAKIATAVQEGADGATPLMHVQAVAGDRALRQTSRQSTLQSQRAERVSPA